MSFAAGQRVRVSPRRHRGHHRTPDYLKGKTGTVDRVHGAFENPETRAYGGDGVPEQRLYLVGFAQHEVWPEHPREPVDRIYADVYEHWLEEAE